MKSSCLGTGLVLALGWGLYAVPALAADAVKSVPPATPATRPAAAPLPAAAAPSLDKREIRAQLMPRRYTTLAAEIDGKFGELIAGMSGRVLMMPPER
ncbi:hypothetical protein [Azohydromonas lata]|uniref:Uncharacterized protein n=1 Tax=Azohydromonas lata TaxID=45677 RepID=A0ABU5IRK0_9BURK|nr:hypothetical protein [Azohydromonas lata]MDZ5461528.1 hypothetical protein [Azohydromonas lata]